MIEQNIFLRIRLFATQERCNRVKDRIDDGVEPNMYYGDKEEVKTIKYQISFTVF